MAEYIERKALDKALTVAAANDKDKNRRTWAKAICVLHDLPAADVEKMSDGYHTLRAGRKFRRETRRGPRNAQRVQLTQPEAQRPEKRHPA